MLRVHLRSVVNNRVAMTARQAVPSFVPVRESKKASTACSGGTAPRLLCRRVTGSAQISRQRTGKETENILTRFLLRLFIGVACDFSCDLEKITAMRLCLTLVISAVPLPTLLLLKYPSISNRFTPLTFLPSFSDSSAMVITSTLSTPFLSPFHSTTYFFNASRYTTSLFR